MNKIIIFTDLDGTLLDYYNYSFDTALPAVELLKQKEIPLVICSSKTKKEIEYYREKFNNQHPFISENGGGIFIPRDYFDLETESQPFTVAREDDYYAVRLGAKYSDLRNAVKALQGEGFEVKGFGDMSTEELADIANMSISEAEMAKERDFDEPFIYRGAPYKLPKLFKSLNEKGFKFTRGKFLHILGNSNKGIAVSLLIDLYKKKFKQIKTIAIGDSPNDIPMLERVDHPVIVQRPDGKYESDIDIQHIIKAEGTGPAGWNKAIIKLVGEIEQF